MANQEWEWQIRDSKGKWVEMGSSVSFMNAGKSVSGKVIGSPKPGYVTVEGPDGKKTTIASNRVTVTGAPAAGGQKKPDGSGTAPATDKQRRVKAIVPGGFGPALHMSPAKQAVVRAEQRAEREKAAEKTAAKKAPAKKTTTKKKPVGANRGAPASSTNDGGRQDKPTDKRLNGVHSTATQIERLLRIKAKEQGIGDPFGEKEAAQKKKTADAKDGKSDEKSSAKDKKDAKDDPKDKPEKKRIDTRKKLTQSQIDQVAEILKGVMADVKTGKFSGALSRLKKAEGVLSNTSAPWLLKRISWLKKGVANFSLTASAGTSRTWQLRDSRGKWVRMGAKVRWLNRGQFHIGEVTGADGPDTVLVSEPDGGLWRLETARVVVDALDNAPALVAAGGSYEWQLRDRDGRWIEMGSRVSWLAKGLTRFGKVVGSAKEGRAQVRDEQSGETVSLPTTRITAAPRAPYREGWTPVDEFGMDYDPRNATNPLVLAARSLPQSDWDALPPVNWILPNAGGSALHANEPDLKDATLDKARQPGFQFRPGYVNLAVTDEEGRTHIIDGHHRVGLHVVAGHQTMPAKVIDMRYDSPEANKIRALLGQTDGPGALRPPPPTPGVRPADTNTSLTSLAAQDMPFVNNDDSGTPTNPVHTYRWTSGEKAGKSLTVDEATLTAHFTDVLRRAIDGNEPVHQKVSREDLAKAKDWYRAAHQTCLDILAEFPDSGLTLEQVAGVMAAVSPRKAWDVTHPKTGNKSGNVEDCRRVIRAHLYGEVDGVPLRDLPISEAKKHTRAGMHSNVAIGLRILRGEDPSVMTGTKRKSFWNCMVNPENDYDATIDGWMASAIWRAKIKYSDGTEVDEDALDWIDHKKTRGGQTVVPGAGYILMADALRKAAKELGLTPMEAQAIYWVSVGGGRKDTQMWSWERKEKGTTKKAKRLAKQKAMLATGGLIT